MSRNLFYDNIVLELKSKFSDNTPIDILSNMQKVYEDKDNDYSSTGLPMGNLRKCEDAGIEAWRGCIVRMGDKISRLENFLKNQEFKVDEKAEDTIIDLANYSILCACLLNEENTISSDYYIKLNKQAIHDLKKMAYYCVFQASLWKDNDPENDLSNLYKVVSYWDTLAKYSLEMV